MSETSLSAETRALMVRYAQVLVQGGLTLQREQRLLVLASTEAAAFVRELAGCAYRAGASLVDVLYADPLLVDIRLRHAPRDSFAEFPAWHREALLSAARRGDAVLSLTSPALDGFRPQDGAAVATISRTVSRQMAEFSELRRRGLVHACTAAVPTPGWAARVYPEEPAERAFELLWQVVAGAVFADEPDPLTAFGGHLAGLLRRCDGLNSRRYRSLHLTGPGTDLWLGLPDGHRWTTATRRATWGRHCANFPTAEVFTLPHREQAEGVVAFTRPFLIGGVPVEHARVRWRAGQLVDASAQRGEAQLLRFLEQHEPARQLGEVALVANGSRLAAAGRHYHSTLLDENAGCHLAFGNAYRATLHGGEDMTEREFRNAGGNQGSVHLDAVFGSDNTNVDGVLDDGSVEPVMRHGEWCGAADPDEQATGGA